MATTSPGKLHPREKVLPLVVPFDVSDFRSSLLVVHPNAKAAGYNFWLNKLNQFNRNVLNSEMVKALITSDEYQKRFGP
jgi:hypothetical protein